MPSRTSDSQGSRPVICHRRTDYALRLVLYGLRVFFTGMLYCPLYGTGLVPVITRQPPLWWASEARCGFLLLDAARQAGPVSPSEPARCSGGRNAGKREAALRPTLDPQMNGDFALGSIDDSPSDEKHSATDRGATYRSVWRSLMNTDFRQGHVTADGLSTRFVQAGSPADPPVLMLHGTGGHWETFSANIPVLARNFHCTALDMMGCGFTDRPDRPYEINDYVDHVLAFMDVMELERASVIGVSLGSWVACRLALRAPGRVNKLILNSPAGLLPLSAASSAAVGTRHTVTADPSWANTEKVLEHLFYDRRALADDIIAVRQQVYSLPDAGSLSARTLTLFDPEIRSRNLLSREEWAAITAPTLIIAHVDAPDDYLTTAHAIAKLIPCATVADVPHAAHWPHFEQAAIFNALAEDFLRNGSRNPLLDTAIPEG